MQSRPIPPVCSGPRDCGQPGAITLQRRKTKTMTTLTKNLPDVAELNRIHAEWMALDSTGPQEEIDRICRLMEQMPHRHLAVNGNATLATPFEHSMPVWANARPIAEAIAWCHERHGYRLDVAWCGSRGPIGRWIGLSPDGREICEVCDGTHPRGCCAQDGHGG